MKIICCVSKLQGDLPSRFGDQVFYSLCIMQYEDKGEELSDQDPANPDKKLREAIHEIFYRFRLILDDAPEAGPLRTKVYN